MLVDVVRKGPHKDIPTSVCVSCKIVISRGVD